MLLKYRGEDSCDFFAWRACEYNVLHVKPAKAKAVINSFCRDMEHAANELIPWLEHVGSTLPDATPPKKTITAKKQNAAVRVGKAHGGRKSECEPGALKAAVLAVRNRQRGVFMKAACMSACRNYSLPIAWQALQVHVKKQWNV